MAQPLLVLPQGIADRLRGDLLGGAPERMALALARPIQRDVPAFVVDGPLIEIPDAAYDVRTDTAIVLTDEASMRMNGFFARAAAAGRVPVHVHSHPAGARFFSGIDVAHARSLIAWLGRHGGGSFWTVVWPEDADPVAQLWSSDGTMVKGRLRLGLRPIDPADPEVEPLPALDRQRVFGPGLRAAAAELRVGIVGVGGLGMLVADDLARAGFRRFVLIDHDLVEESNLHRLPGIGRADIHRAKVDVARRIVTASCRAVGTEPEVRTLRQSVGAPRSRWRHALAGCDIVLALADTALGRFEALRFALNSGAFYMQAGLGIDVDPTDGRITRVRAEFCTAEPHGHCPVCTNRLSRTEAAVEARLHAGAEIAAATRRAGYVPQVAAPAVLSLNRIAAANLCWDLQRRIAGLPHRDFFRQDMIVGGTLEEATPVTPVCDICGHGTPTVSLSCGDSNNIAAAA